MIDTLTGINMVCKIDHQSSEGSNFNSEKAAKSRWVSQLYAVLMAKIYRKLTIDFDAAPLFFTLPILYELKSEFNGTRLLYAEHLIEESSENKW